MKKAILISALLAVTMCSFTGCGLIGSMSGYVEKSKQAEADANAKSLFNAAATSLTEMDAEGLALPSGIFDSDGAEDVSPELQTKMEKYFSALTEEEFEWIVCIQNGTVLYAAVSETFESEMVGVNGTNHGGTCLLEMLVLSREALPMSQQQLDTNARILFNAAATGMTEMDIKGLAIPEGMFDSADLTGSDAELERLIALYHSGVENKEFEWVVYLEDGAIIYACVAESFDSAPIGTHGEAPEVSTLRELVNSYAE